MSPDVSDVASVSVRYSDLAVARVAAHEAGRVPGVARLQRRAVTRPGRRGGDVSAIETGVAPDGTVEVAVRLVARVHPPPKDTVHAVARAVRDRVAALTGTAVAVEVTITDVEP